MSPSKSVTYGGAPDLSRALGPPRCPRRDSRSSHPALLTVAPSPAAFGAPPYIAAHKDTLKDGTKVEIEGDRLYQWIERQRKLMPDGGYQLKSGKTITVKDGKILDTTIKSSPKELKK